MRKNNLSEIPSLELSQMLHEIKNPLTFISASLQYIETEHPEVHTFQYWEQTRKELQLLCHMLTDLSVFQKGGLSKTRKINLFDFTEDLQDALESFFAERETPLILENSIPDLDFYGDSFMLRLALVNLLKNASESSQKGSPVRLKITTGPHRLFLSIIDKGCGIASEKMKSLYEPFYTTKLFGTGLGIPIAQKIITSHQGTLTAFSIENAGTAFVVSLPLT